MMLQGYPLAVCAALSCMGYGFGLSRLLGVSVNAGDAGILGLLSMALAGCVLHFVTALSAGVQIAVLAVGLGLGAAFWRSAARTTPMALLAGASAFFHRQALTYYDNGLYHLQTFKWNSELPITLGIGNLHGRLAFNSALFVIAPLDDHVTVGWITNLLVLLFVLMACAQRLSTARRHSTGFWYLCLAVCALTAFPTTMSWIGVLNADGVAAMLTIYWFAVALSLPEEARANVTLLVLTAALALVSKLSAAPLMALAAVVVWLYRKSPEVRPGRAIAVAGALVAAWAARGLGLSGCAVYPVTATCVDLPWAVSRAQAAAELLSIRAWARVPGRIDHWNVMASGWSFLGGWWNRNVHEAIARFFLVGGALGVGAVVAGTRPGRNVTLASAGLLGCIVYWFSSAPDVRFGSGYLAAAGILGGSVACAAYFQNSDFIRRMTMEVLAASMLVGGLGLVRDGNTWSPKERPPYREMAAPQGKEIWVTQGGDQCWDHALPCTPYFHPDALEHVHWR